MSVYTRLYFRCSSGFVFIITYVYFVTLWHSFLRSFIIVSAIHQLYSYLRVAFVTLWHIFLRSFIIVSAIHQLYNYLRVAFVTLWHSFLRALIIVSASSVIVFIFCRILYAVASFRYC